MSSNKNKQNSLDNNDQYRNIFSSIAGQDNKVTKLEILRSLKEAGISLKDVRIKELIGRCNKISDSEKLDFEEFKNLVSESVNIIEKAVTKSFTIPDFQQFKKEIQEIYDEVIKNKSGHNADYIPQLARVNPDLFGVSFCSVDGQIMNIGDYDHPFCVQSTSKTISYSIALELNGTEKVHKHVGREPSGVSFNEITLNKSKLPHNPMINAGAIMTCSLIKPELDLGDRFEYITNIWDDLAGEGRVGFDNTVYHSEKLTANRNFALAHFMKEVGAFPDNTDIHNVLDFYFQCCSIQVTARQTARILSTIANGGICPLNNKKVFSPATVKNCLSMMYSCGMYDFSGEYAFTVGLPAKSGVSGALMIVIPNVGGFAIFSPRLDENHNTVRGVDFSKRLVEKFSFHNYEHVERGNKLNPAENQMTSSANPTLELIWAASQGDISEIKRLIAHGVDINKGDYDKRTALHLAAAEGQHHAVSFLISKGAEISTKDRWGRTALDDAKTGNHKETIAILENFK